MAQPSPIERQFLDLMDRIEQDQEKRIMQLQARVQELETASQKTASDIKRLEALMTRQAIALDSLNSTLARFLAPPAWEQSLPASPSS